MKNLLLLLLLAGLGVWYYYDKNGTIPFIEKQETTTQTESRVFEIEKRAEKLFPTKLEERERWVKKQILAMNKLDAVPKNISPADYANILKLAKEKYGVDYSRQFNYVANQTSSLSDLTQMIRDSALSQKEKAEVTSHLRKEFPTDFSAQRDCFNRIIEAYNIIKEKSHQLSPADFEKLMIKTMPLLVKSPLSALKFFDQQALARYNFLTKNMPEKLKGLREQIESKYPDDFVAQLKDLNTSIDNALNNTSMRFNTIDDKLPDSAKEIFNKYVYVLEGTTGTYPAYFTTMNGKKTIVFPSCVIDKSVKKLNIGGGEFINLDKIYLSQDNGFGIVVLEKENKIETLPLVRKTESVKNKTQQVEIIGFSSEGKRVSILASLENGTSLKYDNYDQQKAIEKLLSGAIIVNRETKKPIAFIERLPNFDLSLYKNFDSPDIENILNNGARVSLWKGLGGAVKLAKREILTEQKIKIVYLEDIKKFSRYDAKKYDKQRLQLEALCNSNYGAMNFLLVGKYYNDKETPIVQEVAEKYRPIFVKGSRTTVNVLYQNFSKYVQSVRMALRQNSPILHEDYSDFYYDLAIPAQREVKIFLAFEKSILDTIARNEVSSVLHMDIAMAINGSSFVPQEFTKPKSGNSMTLTLRNTAKKK